MNARWYDPQTGRFITEDPARDGVNWYAYCGNNPLNFTDPTGLTTLDDYAYQMETTHSDNAVDARNYANAQEAANHPTDSFSSIQEDRANIYSVGLAIGMIGAGVCLTVDGGSKFGAGVAGAFATGGEALAIPAYDAALIASAAETAAGITSVVTGINVLMSQGLPSSKELIQKAKNHNRKFEVNPTSKSDWEPHPIPKLEEQTPPTTLGKALKFIGGVLDLLGNIGVIK